ncbi:hypothetical protein HYPBUDRAFT_113211 [Hyphopichia burtonii NRRL Y-1933]|uniref:Long chronological lifespan protein 2 n=1 Tax=Hyphopichia burtonii NRRL Y-1933 TaxID=984485 RepID=A0A1E4REX9_9ASCO|nr:hypothetical protein HYPBUDRAFT_113211 [Hyphopichia burtonii NRRL Y-1933]ODV65675.1 hypothetical protein HYPBUDRAFT_113211 [Hyphopichia burtonii NRRL Y-1933]
MWQLIILLTLVGLGQASIFDFLNHQFHGNGEEQRTEQNPLKFEEDTLNRNCNKYLCPDTLLCVDKPKLCPCPYPSSQLKCMLPNERYICISKPSGEDLEGKYDDPRNNWKVDAKNDDIRDCGWVNRAWRDLL